MFVHGKAMKFGINSLFALVAVEKSFGFAS